MMIGFCELCGKFERLRTLRLTFIPHDASDPSAGDLIPSERVPDSAEDEFVLTACEPCIVSAFEVADDNGFRAVTDKS